MNLEISNGIFQEDSPSFFFSIALMILSIERKNTDYIYIKLQRKNKLFDIDDLKLYAKMMTIYKVYKVQ